MNENRNLPPASIVILNYNGKELLRDCFSSLQNLDYPEELIEIILVDNGSSDGSIEYIEQYFPGIKIIKKTENLGFAKGCNIGATFSKSSYIVFLNNDMRVDENWLKELILPLMEDKSIGITSSKILNWDGSKIDYAGAVLSFNGHGYKRGENQEPDKYNTPEYCLIPSGGSMAISKKLFLKLGGFDEDYFAYFEDIDLGWRSWIFGYSVLFVPGSIVYHKKSQTQTKAKIKHVYLLEKNALCTILKNYDLKNVIPLFSASFLLFLYRMQFDKERRNWKSLKERKDVLRYLLKNFIKFLYKRIYIQNHRKNKDAYIFQYFKTPFCTVVIDYYQDDQKYISEFNRIIEQFKIRRIFFNNSITDNTQVMQEKNEMPFKK
ncbi:Glycosyltransferase AglI [uncultured archaeon]|nr:Glycosyltransferase AglI [uncultured archaeon]